MKQMITDTRRFRSPSGSFLFCANGLSSAFRFVLFGLIISGVCGCRDESRFRPKVGGGLKRDSGDDTPALPPEASNPVVVDNSTATRRMDDEKPATNPLPTAPESSPTPQEAPRITAPAATKKVGSPRTRKSGVAGQTPTGLKLECDGTHFFGPLLLKRLLANPDKRTVWQLTSSIDEEKPSGSAVCLQFETEGDNPADWVQKRMKARMFVQTSAGAPIFFTAIDSAVEIEFSIWDEEGVEGRLLSGELQSTAGDRPVTCQGSFVTGRQDSGSGQGESE